MNIYNELYSIISNYIYGNNLDEFSELVCTLCSTLGCLFLIAIPFVVVFKIIKLLIN